jgi:hypothetical protein
VYKVHKVRRGSVQISQSFSEGICFYYLKEMEWKFNQRVLRLEEKAIEIAKIFPCVAGD